jgi:hypothetical protein
MPSHDNDIRHGVRNAVDSEIIILLFSARSVFQVVNIKFTSREVSF